MSSYNLYNLIIIKTTLEAIDYMLNLEDINIDFKEYLILQKKSLINLLKNMEEVIVNE